MLSEEVLHRSTTCPKPRGGGRAVMGCLSSHRLSPPAASTLQPPSLPTSSAAWAQRCNQCVTAGRCLLGHVSSVLATRLGARTPGGRAQWQPRGATHFSTQQGGTWLHMKPRGKCAAQLSCAGAHL